MKKPTTSPEALMPSTSVEVPGAAVDGGETRGTEEKAVLAEGIVEHSDNVAVGVDAARIGFGGAWNVDGHELTVGINEAVFAVRIVEQTDDLTVVVVMPIALVAVIVVSPASDTSIWVKVPFCSKIREHDRCRRQTGRRSRRYY